MAIVSATYSIERPDGLIISDVVSPRRDEAFAIALSQKYAYDIGIDQSTSCTGIAIRSLCGKVNVLIEMRNDSFDKNSYYRSLKSLIKRLVKDQYIRMVVCEDPPYVKGKKYTSTILLELRGKVEAWMEDIEELQKASFNSIFPQSWKSLVLDKSKGKHRSNDKACIAEDICDIIPAFNKYRKVYAAKDYDGFDAFGVLLGYLRYAFTEEGVPLICGKVEKRHTSFVGYRYIPIVEANPDTINDFLGDAVKIFKPKFLQFNDRYNKFTNVRMATSNNECSYTIFPEECLDVLKWEFDIEPQDDHVLVAYLFNYSHYPQITKTALKKIFPMNEEIVDC